MSASIIKMTPQQALITVLAHVKRETLRHYIAADKVVAESLEKTPHGQPLEGHPQWKEAYNNLSTEIAIGVQNNPAVEPALKGSSPMIQDNMENLPESITAAFLASLKKKTPEHPLEQAMHKIVNPAPK